MAFVHDLGEDGVIDLFIRESFEPSIVKGIGDDCAVIRAEQEQVTLLSKDLLIEGIHFDLDYTPPEKLGAKSLAVNLSDIAAMGGKPHSALLALALPPTVRDCWIRSFSEGFMQMAAAYDCQIIGGDTCAAKEHISISVSVLGTINENEVMYRQGARDGDDIWISGIPGMSYVGYKLLTGEGYCLDDYRENISRHLTPLPDVELGRLLASKKIASSCIDTSDGISQDLARICALNKVGAVLRQDLIPLPKCPESLCERVLDAALHGGEDYRLLFTAEKRFRGILEPMTDIYRIGNIVTGDSIVLVDIDGNEQPVKPGGFKHF